MASGRVTIDENRCKGCGVCVSECPPEILELSRARLNTIGYPPIVVTDMALCTGCGVCAVLCPDVVFTVYRQPPRKSAGARAALS